MTITVKNEDLLPELGDTPTLENDLHACWGWHHVLEVCVSYNGTDIHACIKLVGHDIACGNLSAAKPELCAKANVAVAKADVCVVADFTKREVKVKGKACYWAIIGWHCTHLDHVIFHF
jgi:hypothetical protein